MSGEIKISDDEFFAILRENGGLYAKTAKAIEEQLAIKYTRQAVRQRALEHAEEVADIMEEVADRAEDGLFTLMLHEDPRVKIDAIKFYLKSKAKIRGYTEKTEHEVYGKDGAPLINIIMPPGE